MIVDCELKNLFLDILNIRECENYTGEDCVSFEITGDNKFIISFKNEDGYEERVFNLYEIISKIKGELVYYGKGYVIGSFRDFDGTWFANVSPSSVSFSGNSEVEAVLKAFSCIIKEEEKIDVQNN